MCYYRTADGMCKKHSDNVFTAYCVEGPCPDDTPTNADRIRSMSDEELADELTKNPPIPCRTCEHYSKLAYCDAPHDFTCVTAYAEALTLDWLQQPAETEGTE